MVSTVNMKPNQHVSNILVGLFVIRKKMFLFKSSKLEVHFCPIRAAINNC